MKLAYCVHCGMLFEAKRSTAKFCNPKHRVAFSRGQDSEPIDFDEVISHSAEMIKKAYGEAFVQLVTIKEENGDESYRRAIMAIRAVIASETNN